MADFNRGRSGGGNFKRRFNDRGGFGGGRGFDRPTMHQAVCDKCRQDCEVPFRPTSGKPIYCKSCFDGNRQDSGRSENRNFDRPTPAPRPQYEEQFALLNSKMDKILNILMPAVAELETEVSEEEVKTPKKAASKKK